MEKIIYIQLLSEGSIAYWPVPALQVGINLFRVSGLEIYDPKDEEWEFPPGSYVSIDEQIKDGKYISIAIQQKVE